MSIPRVINQGWFGPKPAPYRLINQWKHMYEAAGWKHVLWTDRNLPDGIFHVLRPKMDEILSKPHVEFNGICDLARWCIMREFGGWFVDADAVPVEVFPDEWNDNAAVAFWENEICRPGLVAAGYFGCIPGATLVWDIVNRIRMTDVSAPDKMAWQTVGPVPLTEEGKSHPELVVLPSRHVIPQHFSGVLAPGNDKIYAHQLFLSTHHGGYEQYQ